MTRETKVGLIVAGSFLILVGIVVVSKLRRGDEVSGQEEQSPGQVAAVRITEKDPKKAEPAKKPNPAPSKAPPKSKGATIVIRPTEPKDGKPGNLDLPPSLPPLSFPSAGNKPQNFNEDVLRQAVAKNQQDNKPAPLQIDFGPLPKPTGKDDGGTIKLPPLDKGPAVVLPPSGVSDPLPLPAPVRKQDETPGTLTFPPLGNPGGVVAPPKDDGKKSPPKDSGKPLDVGPLVIPPPVGGEKPLTPQAEPLKPMPKDSFPTFPPIGNTDQVPPPPKQNLEFPPKKNTDVGSPPSRPVDLQPKGFSEIPTIPSNPAKDNGVFPSVPPIALGGGKPALPVVKDVVSDFHVCKPDETNLAIISQRLYGSEKYAEALHAYNKAHYTQVRNGAVFLVDRPALSTGQEVLHPTVAVLERDFSKWISGVTPPTSPSVPSITPPVKLTTPTPLGGASPTPVAPVVASGRIYTVQNANGESILDIAERALGNRTRWFEIHSLNRSYQPQFRIPAGTQLKLP